MKNIFKSLTFWTLLVGVVMFAVTYYVPTFPLNSQNVLALVLFVLGLIGVVPTFRIKGVRAALAGGVVNVLAFWQLIAGFVWFCITFFAPTFPLTTDMILGAILFILSYFNIKPELRARGLIR